MPNYESTDEGGATHNIPFVASLGRLAAAASKGVVLSTEDLAAINGIAAAVDLLLRNTALAVSLSSTPLPTNAATDTVLGAKLDDLLAALNPVDLTDDSIASASGSSQQALPADADRRYVLIGNPNASNAIWYNPTGGAAVANGAGSFRLAAGEKWEPLIAPTNQINVIATASDKVSVVYA